MWLASYQGDGLWLVLFMRGTFCCVGKSELGRNKSLVAWDRFVGRGKEQIFVAWYIGTGKEQIIGCMESDFRTWEGTGLCCLVTWHLKEQTVSRDKWLAHGFPLSASSGEVAGTRIAIGALQSGGVWQRISMGELRWPTTSSVNAGGRLVVGIVSRR